MKLSLQMPDGRKFNHSLETNLISIGRSPSCTISVLDESLSRNHAEIELIHDLIYVTDLGSSNGVYIDGNRIIPNIKTLYSPFQSLSFAQIDCQISLHDGEALSSNQSIDRSPIETISATRPTRKMNRDAFKKELKMAPKSRSKENLRIRISTLVIVSVFGAIAYQSMNKTDNADLEMGTSTLSQSLPSENLTQVGPKKATPARDEFLDTTIYLEKFGNASCVNFQTECKDFKLDEAEKEGVAKVEDEYLIFYKPLKHLDTKSFNSFLNDPKLHDIVALYGLLLSKTIDETLAGTHSQLHFIIINNENKPHLVYRIHPDSFKKSKTELIKELGKAAATGSSDTFFNQIKDRVPSMEIQ